MKSEITVKQEQILDTAIRRFSHFGIAKTTLTEIADDLAVSKQALAYYFHDKPQLIIATLERITLDYIKALKAEMDGSGSVEMALLKLTEVKKAFSEKYFMLALEADNLDQAFKGSLPGWKESLKKMELELMVPMFEKGVENGELKPLDAVKTGELLLDTLYAFSKCVKQSGGLPDPDAFMEVFAKQKEVISLFYKGLKKETWETDILTS
jgi:TetR/AcrR family transcriptional regulator